jgi:putative transposase
LGERASIKTELEVGGSDETECVACDQSIESLNFSLRRITKARGSFPSDEAAIKLLFLGLRSITKRWTMPVHDWKAALNQLSMLFEDRMPA